jgi:hypothetical protein
MHFPCLNRTEIYCFITLPLLVEGGTATLDKCVNTDAVGSVVDERNPS